MDRRLQTGFKQLHLYINFFSQVLQIANNDQRCKHFAACRMQYCSRHANSNKYTFCLLQRSPFLDLTFLQRFPLIDFLSIFSGLFSLSLLRSYCFCLYIFLTFFLSFFASLLLILSLYCLVFSLFLCVSLIDFVSILSDVFSLSLLLSYCDCLSIFSGLNFYIFLCFSLIAFVSIFSGIFLHSLSAFFPYLAFVSVFLGLVCDFSLSLRLRPCLFYLAFFFLLRSLFSSYILFQRNQLLCFLSSLPLRPKRPRQCLAPTCHLPSLN